MKSMIRLKSGVTQYLGQSIPCDHSYEMPISPTGSAQELPWCADYSRAAEEQLCGTAKPIDLWFLVECPSRWEHEAESVLPAAAQWTWRDASAPRLANGKVNLAAPAPKQADGKLDLSGEWQVHDTHLQFNMTVDTPGVELTPVYAAIYKGHVDQEGKDRPSGNCLPHSIPDAMLAPTPFKIIHTPKATLILYEEFVDFRQVFTDGRALPKDPEPAWFGSLQAPCAQKFPVVA